MGTPVTNFGKATVSTGYDAAATSIVLATGHGSRFPSTFPYPLTWWNATDWSDAADDPNREIVKVTARTGDTLTVLRAQEGTSASTKNTGGKTYKMALGITKAMWDGIFTNSLSQSFRGLTVMNHPDADKAASQVRFSADAIVMDDGQEIKGWTNIDVSLAASGVNGLDTGSEQASTAYELWAISDGGTNKKGVFKRAKDYFLDEDSSAGEDGQHALRDATARTKLAQGFKVDTAGPLEFVDLKLVKTGTPTGNYWLTVENDSGGVPSGTVLATSDKYDVSLLTTNNTWVRLPFRTTASLSAAAQYHLVLQGDFTVSASNFMSWRADTTAAAYANGSKAAFDGTTWTADTDDDFMFKVYIARNDTAVTLPTGYSQKALICPFAYNDSGSNLLRFMQQDRTIHCYAQAADSSSANDEWTIFAVGAGPLAPTLYHLGALTPPRPCTISVVWANNTGAISAQFGHITATWLVNFKGGPGASPGGYASTTGGDGHALSMDREVSVEYQGLMAISGGVNTFARINRIDW